MPPITPLVGAFLGLLAAGLGTAISLRRLADRKARRVPEQDPRFINLQRAHGNLIEHGPLLVVLLLLVELGGAPRQVLLVGGAVVVLARIAHAIGMAGYLKRPNPFLFSGATLTYVAEVGLSALAAVYAFV